MDRSHRRSVRHHREAVHPVGRASRSKMGGRQMKIIVQDLCFSYGKQEVLKNVNFEFTSDQPVVLLGGSGMGKTTLLRTLAGLAKPQSGKIDGIDSHTRIAVMYQEDRLFPHLTVWQNLLLVCEGLEKANATQLLQELNLDPAVLEKYPAELSGGMRRRAALARALLFPAELVLMDEPFQGLDIETRAMALKAVKKYTKGRPLLLISHEPADAEALEARALQIADIKERHT